MLGLKLNHVSKRGHWWFISVTWIILQLLQQTCMWLCSRPGLSCGLLGLVPWYGACHVDRLLSSLLVVVTPTINQPSMMPLMPSTDLQSLKNFTISSFFYGRYSLIHVTVAPPVTTVHCLHLPGNYTDWRCYSKISDFCWHIFLILVHGAIVVLMSAHHMITGNAKRKLKSLSKEKNPMN